MTDSRREILKLIGTGAVWTTPVIQTVTLPAHAQCSDCQPTQCTAQDLAIVFSSSGPVIVGDIVGFTISSNSTRCANELLNVGFTVVDINGSLLFGILGFDNLDATGSLANEFDIQQNIIDQPGAVGVNISVSINKTGELIGSNSWPLAN